MAAAAPAPVELSAAAAVGVTVDSTTCVYSPDFLSTPTILQGLGLGGGRGFGPPLLSESAVSSLLLLSNADARRPMIEDEECLIVSVSPAVTDLSSATMDLNRSGLLVDLVLEVRGLVSSGVVLEELVVPEEDCGALCVLLDKPVELYGKMNWLVRKQLVV